MGGTLPLVGAPSDLISRNAEVTLGHPKKSIKLSHYWLFAVSIVETCLTKFRFDVSQVGTNGGRKG